MNKVDYANNLFVKKGKYGTKISIKADAFIEDLKSKKNKEGWVNIEIKDTKSGDKMYAVFDSWVPGGDGKQAAQKSYSKPQPQQAPASNDDLPF
jgi:hypothetical protein